MTFSFAIRHVIFLAKAFTRPKLMKGLAKLGFTQSYTYFAIGEPRNGSWNSI